MAGRRALAKAVRVAKRKAILAMAHDNATGAQKPTTRHVCAEESRTALQRLLDAKKLTVKQERGLRTYGALVRAAEMSGAVGLTSCLGALDRVDGGGGSGEIGGSWETAEWIAASTVRLTKARAAMGNQPGDIELDAARAMVLTCDLVAGKGLHPRDITKDQREQAQLESALRIAGDLLAKHFDREHGH